MFSDFSEIIPLRIDIEPFQKEHPVGTVGVERVTQIRLIVPIDRHSKIAERFYEELGIYAWEACHLEACVEPFLVLVSPSDFTKEQYDQVVEKLCRWIEDWMRVNSAR